jgi:Uncharacterized protein conserved in bacteria
MSLVRRKFRNRRLIILLTTGFLVLLIAGGLLWRAEHSGTDFDEVVQEMVVASLNEDPETQLFLGVQDMKGFHWDPTKLSDRSDAYYQRQTEINDHFLEQLTTYNTAELSPEDKLTYDITQWYSSTLQEWFKFSDLNFGDYISTSSFPAYFANNYPVRNLEDAQHYITALDGFADKIASMIDRIQATQKKGIVPPAEFLKDMLKVYENARNSKPEQSILYTLYAENISKIELDPPKQEELKEALLQTLTDHVMASYGTLADLIKNDLMKQAPVGQGIWSQPGGSDYYAALLKIRTSTDLTPLEANEIAKRRVSKLLLEMQEKQASGDASTTASTNGTLAGDELLQAFRDVMDSKPDLSDWFEDALIPKDTADVQQFPAPFSEAGALYVPLSIDGTRGGRVFVPTDQPLPMSAIKLYAVHEAILGHHLQYSIQNRQSIPLARKTLLFSGYIEGWGLYSEALAVEMGLLDRTTVQNHIINLYLGTVIDTGINGLQWTRDQANDYLRSTIGIGSDALIDSVIAIPGLYESYAIGYEQFQSLREKAEDELKDRFDIRAFHSVLLRDGGMPFPVLEQLVDQYIKSAE